MYMVLGQRTRDAGHRLSVRRQGRHRIHNGRTRGRYLHSVRRPRLGRGCYSERQRTHAPQLDRGLGPSRHARDRRSDYPFQPRTAVELSAEHRLRGCQTSESRRGEAIPATHTRSHVRRSAPHGADRRTDRAGRRSGPRRGRLHRRIHPRQRAGRFHAGPHQMPTQRHNGIPVVSD